MVCVGVSAIFWAVAFNILYPDYSDWIRWYAYPIIFSDYPDPAASPVPEIHLSGVNGEPATITKLTLAGGYNGLALGLIPAVTIFILRLLFVAFSKHKAISLWRWALVNGLAGMGASLYFYNWFATVIEMIQSV